jgi:DNA-binding protein HU-beta
MICDLHFLNILNTIRISQIYHKGMVMNKSQFVELVQSSGGYKTKVEAEKAIEAFTGAVTEALVSKNEVALVGFGTFCTALQKGKSGKVPGTDKSYSTEDKIVPKFKSSKSLKSKIEESVK